MLEMKNIITEMKILLMDSKADMIEEKITEFKESLCI